MALDRQVKGYHSYRRSRWDDDLEEDVQEVHPDFAWRRATDLLGCHLGVELELVNDTTYDIPETLPEHTEADGPPPMFERDGSLPDGGVEVIFPPLTPAAMRDPHSYFHRSIAALAANRNVRTPHQCGMHFNVNTSDMSDRQAKAFCCVLLSMPQALMERVGGRALNGYCQMPARAPVYTLDTIAVPRTAHRYCVELANDSSRVECRFPSATKAWARIEELTTLFESVHAFVMQATLRGTDPYHEMWGRFLEWLSNNQEGRPGLYDSLRRV